MFKNETLCNETIEKIYKKIGENVKKYREQKGLSQLELALKMGFKSISLISQAELYKNKRHFNVEHLAKIAHILNIEIEKFFEGVNEIIREEKNKN